MSTESMKKALEERFASELPDFYKRRIIFWRDEDKEFESDFDAIEIDKVVKIKRNEKNNFYLKKLLLHDDLTNNYLVYDPCNFENLHDDWLRDIVLFSEEYRADYISMLMAEMNIEPSALMRKTTKQFKTFFKNKERIKQLRAFKNYYREPKALINDIILVACGVSEGGFANAVVALLKAGSSEENKVLKNLKKLELVQYYSEFLNRLAAFTSENEIDIEELGRHILLSALAQTTTSPSLLKGLERYIPESGRAFCYSVVTAWWNIDKESLLKLCNKVEDELNLYTRFAKIDESEGIGGFVRSDVFPVIDVFIVKKLLKNESESCLNTDMILETVETRRTTRWFYSFESLYDSIFFGAKFLKFMNTFALSSENNNYKKLWEDYIAVNYEADTFYRCFRVAYDSARQNDQEFVSNELENVAENIENLYQNRYLDELNKKWTSAIAKDMESVGRISDLPRQTDFWGNKVESYIGKNEKAFVIISDALRYEVAAELNKVIASTLGGETNLIAMQSMFPSITQTGMAALLPGNNIKLNEKLVVTVDDMPTSTTEQRQALIQKAASKGVAITHQTLMGMKRNEIRNITNGKNVVYIYHNTIDAIGDKAVTEHKVFDACKTAVEELINLMKLIINGMQGSSIFITADHGFLYTARPLVELDKQSTKTTNAEFCEIGKRYAITKINEIADNLIPVSLNSVYKDCQYKGWAPIGITRLKTSGGGNNYVHGGLSLQEMAVPLITYKNHRNCSKLRVEHTNAEILLISQDRKITSMMFKLTFLQTKPVDGKVLPCTYSIFMKDDTDKTISETKTIVADRTDTSEKGRIFEVRINLEPNTFDKRRIYRLVITNNIDSPQEIDYHIDIGCAGDYGFF